MSRLSCGAKSARWPAGTSSGWGWRATTRAPPSTGSSQVTAEGDGAGGKGTLGAEQRAKQRRTDGSAAEGRRGEAEKKRARRGQSLTNTGDRRRVGRALQPLPLSLLPRRKKKENRTPVAGGFQRPAARAGAVTAGSTPLLPSAARRLHCAGRRPDSDRARR